MKGFPNGFVWFVGNNYPIYKEHEHKSCFSSLNIDWSSVSVFFSSLLSASMGLVGGLSHDYVIAVYALMSCHCGYVGCESSYWNSPEKRHIKVRLSGEEVARAAP